MCIRDRYDREWNELSELLAEQVKKMIEDKNWEQVIPIIDSYEKAGRKNSSLEMLKIWKNIYEKANNILLLSIIEAIGMNYQKEMPGYAIELASSMELIYYDIYRSGEFMSNPIKELLEKHILLSVGVPEITGRYEKDEKCACNLQQYFANSYLYGDAGIKNRCHVILDLSLIHI